MEGTDKMVTGGLGGAVRAVRLVAGILCEKGAVHLQGPVNFVGRNMVETLARKTAVPTESRGLKETQRAKDIGLGKRERILDGAVDMALGGKVDHPVDHIVPEDLEDRVEVADVSLHEDVVGGVFNIFEIGKVARIGQFVEVDDAVVRILVDEPADNMVADEAGTAGNKNVSLEFHDYFLAMREAANSLNEGLLRSFSERITSSAGICQSMPRSGSSQAMAPSACGQ